jgi:hypothetical protein
MPISGLIEFSFKSITTYLNEKGEEKKKANMLPLWTSITTSKIEKHHKARAIITGKKTGITVFDFDDSSEYFKLVEECPKLKMLYRKDEKRLSHLFQIRQFLQQ